LQNLNDLAHVLSRRERVRLEVLQRNALIVWLKASVATIVARIEGGTERPALTSGKGFTEEVAEVLERRTPLYLSAANVEIDTDPLTPEQVAERIVEIWQSRQGEDNSAAGFSNFYDRRGKNGH
jgi:shikimate kinase